MQIRILAFESTIYIIRLIVPFYLSIRNTLSFFFTNTSCGSRRLISTISRARLVWNENIRASRSSVLLMLSPLLLHCTVDLIYFLCNKVTYTSPHWRDSSPTPRCTSRCPSFPSHGSQFNSRCSCHEYRTFLRSSFINSYMKTIL